jgi:hypothetical protein
MNNKFLLTILLSICFILPAYSYSPYNFNANEVPIYNNYFYGNGSLLNTNQQYNGFTLSSKGASAQCSFNADTGMKAYVYNSYTDGSCSFDYVLINPLTLGTNYLYQINWDYDTKSFGYSDSYFTLYGYNGTWNVLNETLSKTSTGLITKTFKGYNYTKLRFKLEAYGNNVFKNYNTRLYWFRLYDYGSITTEYTTQLIKPSADSSIYTGLSVPIEYTTTVYTASYVPFYFVGNNNQDFNYTTGMFQVPNFLSFNYLDGGTYHYTGGYNFLYDSDYSDFALYILPISNYNSLISKKISVLRMPILENINITKSNTDLSIIFKEPSQTSIITGTKTNTYDIILSKSGSVLKEFYFPQSDLVNNAKTYTDFSVLRFLNGSDYYIKISYTDSITLPSDSYSLTARYTQNNGTTTAYSSLTTESQTFFYKYIGVYESNITEPMIRLFNYYDNTNYEGIFISPISFGDLNNIEWGIKYTCLNTGSSSIIIPDDFYSGFGLGLCYGENEIIVYYDNSYLNYETFNINYNYNSSLINMSVINYDSSLICYSNTSFNDCNYNNLNKDFYVKTIHDNYNYTLLNVNLFCNVNGTYESFYSDLLTTNNLYWLPYGIYKDTNELIMIFNKKLNVNTQTGLTAWLLSNPDTIKQNEYDFTKILMNSYIKELNQENKYFYTPSGYDCYLETSFNNNRLNVSFMGTYSLYNDIKTSGLFFELNSGCSLDRYKENTILDYGNYGSCLLTTFISDNSNTFYYITFITICIIISKVVLGLFN